MTVLDQRLQLFARSIFAKVRALRSLELTQNQRNAAGARPSRRFTSTPLTVETLESRLVPTTDRAVLAQLLTHSTEFYQNVIQHAYTQYLGRGPDASGLSYWTDQLQNRGVSDERLAASFIGSPEYIANHGGTGEAWVKGMYQDLLGRDVDGFGLQYWLDQLSSQAQTPQQVAYGFAASIEREGIVVQQDYTTFLGRPAGPEEVNYWVNTFVNGNSNENVIAGFVGAVEYYGKHLNSPTAWLTAAYKDILNRTPDSSGYVYWYMQLTGQLPTNTEYNGKTSLDRQTLATPSNVAALTDVSMLTAATDGAGNVREFALDANYRLWIRSGLSWTPESNYVYDITTAEDPFGNVDLFAVDGNHTAWFRIVYRSGNLSNWYQLFPDNIAVASLSAVTAANGDVEIFVTDINDQLFLRTVDQYSNWSGWSSLNGYAISTSVVRDVQGVVELFAIANDTKHVFERIQTADGTWRNWTDLTQLLATTYNYAPVTAYSISASTDSRGGVELFAAGYSGGQSQNVYQAFENGSFTWGDWENLGTNNKAFSIASTQNGSSNVVLFGVGATSHNAFANTETGYANDATTGAVYGVYSGWNQQTSGVTDAQVTGYALLAQQVGTTHVGPTFIYLNFDGGDVSYTAADSSTVTEHISGFTGSAQDIQTIINDVSQIYAPFNVVVQRITGAGNFDSSYAGNTTIFIGADSNHVAANSRKYATSFTPFVFCDAPWAFKGYNHVPNSDAYDLAFVDPVYQQQAGGPLFVESDSQIASEVAHEAGHTFGLMHVLTGDGMYSSSNPPDVMSYDAPNQQFLNQVYLLTDLNYSPTTGGNVHGGDHFYPQWNNNGTIETMVTQDSYLYLLAVLGPHP
jgi:hypothetical protein